MRISAALIAVVLISVPAHAETPLELPRRVDPGSELPAWATCRLGKSRMYHDGNASALVGSPGGNFVALADRTRKILIWEIETRRLAQVLRGGPSPYVNLAYSADGKVLAAGTDSGKTISIWDVTSGRLLHELYVDIAQARGTVALCFLSTRPQLVSYDAQGMVRIWDYEIGTEVGRFHDGYEGPVSTRTVVPLLDVSEGDRLLALARADGRVRLFDLTGKPQGSPLGEGDVRIRGLRFLPHSPELMWSAGPREWPKGTVIRQDEIEKAQQPGEGVFLLNLSGDSPRRVIRSAPLPALRPDTAQDLVISPDGTSLALLSRLGLQVWNATQLEAVQLEPVNSEPVTGETVDGNNAGSQAKPLKFPLFADAAVFTKDSKFLIVGQSTGLLRMFNAQNGLELNPPDPIVLPLGPLAFTKNDEQVVSVLERPGPLENLIRRWDARTGDWLGDASFPSLQTDAAFGIEGTNLNELDRAGVLAGLETDDFGRMLVEGIQGTKEWFGTEPPPKQPGQRSDASASLRAISADGSTLAIDVRWYIDQQYYALRLIDRKTSTIRFDLLLGNVSPHIALSPDGSRLAVYGRNYPARDAAGTFPNPDHKKVLLYDVNRQELLWKSEALPHCKPCFTPDGRSVVVAHSPGATVDFLDVENGKLQFRVLGPLGLIRSAPVFSPNGKLMALMVGDEAVDVFEVATGRLTHRFRAPAGSVIFSHDSAKLLIGLDDSTALVADLVRGQSELAAERHRISEDDLRRAWWNIVSHDSFLTNEGRAGFSTLALGGDRAVTLLQERLIAKPDLDQELLAALIPQLGSEDGRERVAALETLSLGSGAVELPLQEARRRPLTPDQLRDVESMAVKQAGVRTRLAVDVLAVIGSPEAKALVQEVEKTTRFDAATRQRAAETLMLWDVSRTGMASSPAP